MSKTKDLFIDVVQGGFDPDYEYFDYMSDGWGEFGDRADEAYEHLKERRSWEED